jgi:hypothetical protein
MTKQVRKKRFGLLIGGILLIVALGCLALWHASQSSRFEPTSLGYRTEGADAVLVIVVGMDPDYVIDSVTSEESADAVAVTVVARPPARPHSGGLVVLRDVRIQLRAPLGNRRVLYGASQAELARLS